MFRLVGFSYVHLLIAFLSWMNCAPETRFLKETGFLSTSQRMRNAITQVATYKKSRLRSPPNPPLKKGGTGIAPQRAGPRACQLGGWKGCRFITSNLSYL
jgi:hypothetical protein